MWAKLRQPDLTGLTCCYNHCDQPATVLLIASPHNPHRTFGYTQAGVTCEQHARESEQDGCRRV